MRPTEADKHETIDNTEYNEKAQCLRRTPTDTLKTSYLRLQAILLRLARLGARLGDFKTRLMCVVMFR